MPRRNPFRNPAWRGVILGVVCALAVWGLLRGSSLLGGPSLLRGVEDWMLDACFSDRGERPSGADMIIIGIDDATLGELRRPLASLSPELAKVVTHLHAQGASAIGVDLIVPADLRDRPEFGAGEGDARTLGQAVQEAGNVVLAEWWDGKRMQLPLPQWRLKSLDDPDPLGRDLGFVNLTPDGDQILRRQQLLLRVRGSNSDEAVPSFALALHARSRGTGYEWDSEKRVIHVGDESIPLDAEQKLRINFAGPPGRFPTLSFADILRAARRGDPLPAAAGAIVLIGVTAHGQQDSHSTPFANRYANYFSSDTPGLMAGTEVHAHILATLHDRAFIATPVWLSPLPLLLVTGCVLGHILSRLNLGWGMLVAVVHHFVWKFAALGAFTWFAWRIEVVPMLMLGVVLYTATFALRWRTLRRMMGIVKSEGIALALEADPRRLDPGGEEREVTVLFADIRDFTVFSEKHTAQEVVTMLNAYFNAVVPPIEAEGGVIDKYMGDGIMVLFGAPATLPDHALHAARAAAAMVKAVHARRELWRKLDVKGAWGEQGLRIGVGVHTGKVVVGAIGSRNRLDYTAIGDTVNAAARIETENKHLGTEILLSAATHAEIPPRLAAELNCARSPREVKVKGKDELLLLYPVEGKPEGPSEERKKFDVFISYRRESGAETARVIVERLLHQNIRAFLDVDALSSGHFDERLLATIGGTPHFVVILSEGSLDRCRDPGDWMRREVIQALQTGRNIVPVLMPRFQMPDPEGLPEELRPLTKYNGVPYDHVFFKQFIERLLLFLKQPSG